MTQIYVICEGQTEATFVNELLKSHFLARNLFLTPTMIGKTGKKGGNVSFSRLLGNVRSLLSSGHNPYCTTFFDFYGLPIDFPGKSAAAAKTTPRDKAETVCTELVDKLKNEICGHRLQRFIPYVQMYEFEALLFSDPTNFANGIQRPGLQCNFWKIRNIFPTPEHINDSQNTAPSKRIKGLVPRYRKPLMGESAAKVISLDKIRTECPLFNAWLAALENLPPLP